MGNKSNKGEVSPSVVFYRGRKVGGLGRYGRNTWCFTILTPKMHRTWEFKANNIQEAQSKALEICENLAKKTQ